MNHVTHIDSHITHMQLVTYNICHTHTANIYIQANKQNPHQKLRLQQLFFVYVKFTVTQQSKRKSQRKLRMDEILLREIITIFIITF